MIHVARIRLEVAAQLDNNVRVAYTDIETPKGLAAVSCELHIDDRFNVIELTDTAQPWRYAAQDKVTGIAELFADEQDLKMWQVETSGNVQQHSA
ncbi:UNVERIFIED_CONTAM: hypothetical protein GTU68_050090 [Idotea baltica]|nr:hypothetical protein [Idotea baltica]